MARQTNCWICLLMAFAAQLGAQPHLAVGRFKLDFGAFAVDNLAVLRIDVHNNALNMAWRARAEGLFGGIAWVHVVPGVSQRD